jgi:pimeloyl-ACP methyl ester carboxylesterase
MQEAKPIAGIPVILLTPATTEPLSAEAMQYLSPSTQQIIAEKSAHWIHLDEPELVLEAIQTVITHLRSNPDEDAAGVP